MNNFNLLKTLGGAACIMATAINANAVHLTPAQALERLHGHSQAMKAPGVPYTLVHSEGTDGSEALYVFNQGEGGFVILAADDRMPAVLGYSDEGAFDPSAMPPQMKWLLSVYSHEAAALAAIPDATRAGEGDGEGEGEEETRNTILPLLLTRWGQNHPYNLMCPPVGDGHCVTGCVATAMAQIMKYYEYPSAGIGSHSYSWNGEMLEYDFSQPFGFDSMLYSYPTVMDVEEESMEAVARLMYACGVSVNMNYGVAGSDAPSQNIPYALTRYFGYDPGVRYIKKAFYTPSDWEDLVYAELAEGRPVIYGGNTPGGYGDDPSESGGHQFILDGYLHPGFFHVNWGWDGMENGYFRLSALEPEIQGTGGFEGGYNVAQTAVVGLRPAVEGSARWYPVYGGGSIGLAKSTKTQLQIVYAPQMGLLNHSDESFSVELFLKVSDDATGQEYVAETGRTVNFIPEGGIQGTLTFSLPSNLPEGDYTGRVVMKTPEGNWQEILYPVTAASTFRMHVTASGNKTFEVGESLMRIQIALEGFHPETLVIPGEETQFSYTVRNVGDVDCQGIITVVLYPQDSDEPVEGQTKVVHFPILAPEHSFTGHVDLTYDVEPGEYYIICYDSYGDPISEAIPLPIGVDGVEQLFGAETTVDVYSVNGQLIRKGADAASLSDLPKGIYLYRTAGKTIKVFR